MTKAEELEQAIQHLVSMPGHRTLTNEELKAEILAGQCQIGLNIADAVLALLAKESVSMTDPSKVTKAIGLRGDFRGTPEHPTCLGWLAAQAPAAQAYAVYLAPGFGTTRGSAEACFVLAWPDADLLIPWPEGLTPKQAIVAWAKDQPEPQG